MGDGIPARGGARLAGTRRLTQGHTPGKSPDWFSPAEGTLGSNRFDLPHPRRAGEPGVCYLAEDLTGVLHERVFRGLRPTSRSRSRLSLEHAVSPAVVERDLVLLDLMEGLTVHGLQVDDVASRPDPAAKPPVLRYQGTQRLGGTWVAMNAVRGFPVPGGRTDGILYASRFATTRACVALWDYARATLIWGPATPLADHPGLDAACLAIGIGLLD